MLAHTDYFSIMRGGPLIRIVQSAKAACRSFAEYQDNFFDFARPHAWRGWENWLAVDIGRRLNIKTARPFKGSSRTLVGELMRESA
jgi:hypothetical protein